MENYVRTETHLDLDTQREPNPCEMRITTQGKLRNYISYATILLNDKRSGTISLLAMGKAISKAISIAEILKKRIDGLVQTTEIGSTSFTETYEPLVVGLERVQQTRHVSLIKIILTDTRSHAVTTTSTTETTTEEGEGLPAGQFGDNKRGYRGRGSRGGGRGGRGRGGRGRGGARPYYGAGGPGPYPDQLQQSPQHIPQQQPLQQQTHQPQPPANRNPQQQVQQFSQPMSSQYSQPRPQQIPQHHQQQHQQQHQHQPQPWGGQPSSQPVFSETWGDAQGFDMVPTQSDYHRPRGRGGRGRGNNNSRGRGNTSGQGPRGGYNRQ